MEIITLNAGQGQFVIVKGTKEAFIVDTHYPESDETIADIEGALKTYISGLTVTGLIFTGFDADHLHKRGLEFVLDNYPPNWIMYPKYFHDTDNAKECFKVIKGSGKPTHSVLLTNNKHRFFCKLSDEFYFEVFSPHVADRGSSNNCSLVAKVVERSTDASCLITGDTEEERWNTITKEFGSAMDCHVMAAPHHGSKTGATKDLMASTNPHTVLISAGVNNQYGHPDTEAIKLFNSVANSVLATNKNGHSFQTIAGGGKVNNYYF